MATLNVGTRPDLTPEKALDAFTRRFGETYKVHSTRVLMRDFIVEKSMLAGVSVRVKQGSDGATFVYTATIPNPIARVLLGGLVSYLFMGGARALEAEVKEFIQQEFAAGTAF